MKINVTVKGKHQEFVNDHHQRWWLEGFAQRAYWLVESPKRS